MAQLLLQHADDLGGGRNSPDTPRTPSRAPTAAPPFTRACEDVLPALDRLSRAALAGGPGAGRRPAPPLCRALLVRVLQRRTWPQAAQALGLSGQGEARRCLREAARALLLAYAPEAVRREATRLSSMSPSPTSGADGPTV